MSRGWKLYWLLVLVTLVVYFVMVLWSLPLISKAAGGQLAFDLRPFGYTVDEARAFLFALSDEGAVFYSTVQHKLDTVYPALVCAVLVIPLWHLSENWSKFWRVLLVLIPVTGSTADYLENNAVATMLAAGEVSDDLITTASGWTILKSSATTIAAIALIGMLLLDFFRKYSARSRSN